MRRHFLTAALVCGCFAGITGAKGAQEPILLRLDAPVGGVTKYRTQTQSWLPGFPTFRPLTIMTDVTTESVTAVEGDVRVVSAVVESSQYDMTDPRTRGKNLFRGQTKVFRIDSRGRVLSTEVTRQGEGMKDQGGNEKIQGESSTMPHAGGAFTLAETPVRVGDSWSATERVYLGPGTGGLHADVQVSYKLERVDLEGGARVAVISMNGPIVTWLHRAGTGVYLRLEASPIGNAPPTGTMSGEIRLDLDAKRVVSLTMNIEDRWGTRRGLKTRMTRTAQ